MKADCRAVQTSLIERVRVRPSVVRFMCSVIYGTAVEIPVPPTISTTVSNV